MGKSRKVPESNGFDIVVWQKNELSPTWACGYTQRGADYLHSFNKNYVVGRAMKLDNIFPQEFMRLIDGKLKVGGTTSIHRIPTKLVPPPLQ